MKFVHSGHLTYVEISIVFEPRLPFAATELILDVPAFFGHALDRIFHRRTIAIRLWTGRAAPQCPLFFHIVTPKRKLAMLGRMFPRKTIIVEAVRL